jgi:8-oxo-dGTP diphosphatase
MKSAAGILFLRYPQNVLMVQTSYRQHWDLPGGMIEEGETPVEAAIRECKEELGIVTIPKRLLTQQFLRQPNGDILSFWIFLGDAHSVTDILVDGEEVVDAEWCDHRTRSQRTMTAPILRKRIDDALTAVRTGDTIYREVDKLHS